MVILRVDLLLTPYQKKYMLIVYDYDSNTIHAEPFCH